MEDAYSSSCSQRVARSMKKSGVVVNHDYKMPFLPEDIVFKILVSLPAKVLHDTMRRVCRAWRKLIRDPVFTKVHLLQSSHNSPFSIARFDDYFQLYSITKRRTTWRLTKRINQRCLAQGVGLILFADYNNDSLVLYLLNPITKQIITLPHPPISHTDLAGNWAFAYSPSTSKYKVVCTSYQPKAYILTVGVDKKWRNILVEPNIMRGINTDYTRFPPQGICGFIYWYHGIEKYIIVLDLEEETFYKIGFFEEIEGRERDAMLIKSDTILGMATDERNNCWKFWELVDYKNGGEWRRLGILDFESEQSKIDKNIQQSERFRVILKNRDEVIYWSYKTKRSFAFNFMSGMVSPYFISKGPLCENVMFTNSLIVL